MRSADWYCVETEAGLHFPKSWLLLERWILGNGGTWEELRVIQDLVTSQILVTSRHRSDGKSCALWP